MVPKSIPTTILGFSIDPDAILIEIFAMFLVFLSGEFPKEIQWQNYKLRLVYATDKNRKETDEWGCR